jgi:hypothetical protein
MKPWRESIRLHRPLRDARLAGKEDLEARAQEREEAAFERGRVAGEKALGEQLVRQRADLLDLQSGVLESLRQAIPGVVRDTEVAVITLALEVARKLVADCPSPSPWWRPPSARPWHKWRTRVISAWSCIHRTSSC